MFEYDISSASNWRLGMEQLEQAIRALETRYGEIDNIKFLLGGSESMSADVVFDEVLKAANCLANGQIVPSANFDDSALLK